MFGLKRLVKVKNYVNYMYIIASGVIFEKVL